LLLIGLVTICTMNVSTQALINGHTIGPNKERRQRLLPLLQDQYQPRTTQASDVHQMLHLQETILLTLLNTPNTHWDWR